MGHLQIANELEIMEAFSILTLRDQSEQLPCQVVFDQHEDQTYGTVSALLSAL